jgi:hypothetical protein
MLCFYETWTMQLDRLGFHMAYDFKGPASDLTL